MKSCYARLGRIELAEQFGAELPAGQRALGFFFELKRAVSGDAARAVLIRAQRSLRNPQLFGEFGGF